MVTVLERKTYALSVCDKPWWPPRSYHANSGNHWEVDLRILAATTLLRMLSAESPLNRCIYKLALFWLQATDAKSPE